MPGRSRWAALGVLLVLTAMGVALATPVPVLALSDGRRELVGRLEDGDGMTYSYEQSIYGVPVYEEFKRSGDTVSLIRVRSSDIRSVEYFRWDGDIVRGPDGLWTETAPRNTHTELLIRVTSDGEQRVVTGRGWSVDLYPSFGESLVTVRIERRPLALVLGAGAAR